MCDPPRLQSWCTNETRAVILSIPKAEYLPFVKNSMKLVVRVCVWVKGRALSLLPIQPRSVSTVLLGTCVRMWHINPPSPWRQGLHRESDSQEFFQPSSLNPVHRIQAACTRIGRSLELSISARNSPLLHNPLGTGSQVAPSRMVSIWSS